MVTRDAVGSHAYYIDFALVGSYSVAWLCLLAAVFVSEWRLDSISPHAVRVGATIGFAPEIAVSATIWAGAVPLRSWHSWLGSIVFWLQTPGRLIASKLSNYDRWAFGLTDPPTSYAFQGLVVLNLSNLVAWIAFSLAARFLWLRWARRRAL